MRKLCVGVLLATLFFIGCGNARIQPPLATPSLAQEHTFLVGDALVSFQVEEVNHFQTNRYVFNGSVRNNGPTLANARFEILTETRRNLPGDGPDFRIEATQFYGRFLTGTTHQIALDAEVINVANVFVTGRFVSDGPEAPPPTGPIGAAPL